MVKVSHLVLRTVSSLVEGFGLNVHAVINIGLTSTCHDSTYSAGIHMQLLYMHLNSTLQLKLVNETV